MAAAIALGGFTGPEADTLGYAIRKKKSSRPARAEGEVRHPGAPSAACRRRHRPGLRGVRAVRALRLQQGPRHLLRADRVPDRVPQGELHGRLHGQRAVGVPRQRGEGRGGGRRVPPARDRGPAAGRPPQPRSSSPSRTRAIRFGLLAVKNVGQGAIESIIAAREAEGPFKSLGDLCRRIDLRLANRKVLESLAKVGALYAFGHPAQILEGSTTRSRPARPRSATSPRARRRCSTWARRSRWSWSGRSRRRPRRRSASGCAGRRSSSGCTCPSTRWARSPTRSASS